MKKNKSKGTSSGGTASGARRPQRQRTQVQHYADNDPGTFTKKKKRRRSGNAESDSSESDSEEDQQQQHYPDEDELEYTIAPSVDLTNHAKKRRGPQKSLESTSLVTNSNIGATKISISHANNSSSNKSKTKRVATGPKLQEMPPRSPPKTFMMPHTSSIAPILPLATTCPLARSSLAQQYPVIFGRGLGLPSPPPTPEWNPISQYDFYFPQDYKLMPMPTNQEVEDINAPTKEPTMAPLLKKGPWPVCRVVTTVCAPRDSFYLAVGDSAGFILLYTGGVGRKTMGVLTRLNTTASQREHPRQRDIQAKLEHKCRNNPELLDKRSAFWATEKTPNAIQFITWVGNLIVFLTPQEIEAIQLTTPASSQDFSTAASCPSQALGGCQNCLTLWTIPVTTVGPRKANGNMTLLTGGELVGSYLELHRQGNKMLWNTWGVTTAVTTTTTRDEDQATNQQESKSADNSSNDVAAGDEWPLLLLRDPHIHVTSPNATPGFVKLIPFQRNEEDEMAPPVAVKRSPGRPPKKKPKPKIPVAESELIWKAGTSKCHAAMWQNGHSHKGDRLIVVYSGSSVVDVKYGLGGSNGDAPQVQMALLKLTDDISEEDAASGSPSKNTIPQYAKLVQQTAVPISASARNVANVPEVTLNQSTRGTYTFVSGPRGVRMYKTESMVCLRVYGEGVSLHGKAMVWQSCVVLDNRLQQQLYQQEEEQMKPPLHRSAKEEQTDGSNTSNKDDDSEDESTIRGATILRHNRQGFVWIEQDNLLASLLNANDSASLNSNRISTRRSSSLPRIRASSSVDKYDDEEDDESYWLHQAWIVGIPHPFRGPKELTETLYFWQGTEKLPLFTLPLPQQSGGAHSMHSLLTSSDRHRNEGMWLRLMVSTVHGECFELAPSVKSDFSGNMYNPGYFVVRDNVDYIEDEDELDKVMVEVAEEEEESNEEDPIVAVAGSGGDGDVVDPELAEAIRLSLLESQGKPGAHNEDGASEDEDDEIVVVKDDFGDNGSGFYIPCKPEPYLREKLLPEFESETLIDVDATGRDKSATDAEFANGVLSILPQAKSAQDRWEEQKGKLKVNEQVTVQQLQLPFFPQNGSEDASSLPTAARLGRGGKRVKPGNLESLLKASIKPTLRQFMTERGRAWADGSGGTLQVDAWDDVGADSKECSSEPPDRPNQQASPSYPSGFPKFKDSDGNNSDKAAVSKELVGVQIKPHTTMNRPVEMSSDLAAFSSAGINGNTASSIENATLQVRPILAPTVESNTGNEADSIGVSGMQVAIIELKDYSDSAQQYWCTGTVAIPSAPEDCKLFNSGAGAEAELHAQEEELQGHENTNPAPNHAEANVGGETTQSPSLAHIVQNATRGALPGADAKMSGAKRVSQCAACLGRMVTHSCGKRALPIDFEAIARAEQERKAHEEEERRKLTKEKRRQADVKRREERRMKKEDDKRKKKEQEAELQRLREAEIAEARANQANIGELLDSGSPRHNGVVNSPDNKHDVQLPTFAIEAAKGVDEVHFAIASAWKEHAEKFTESSVETVEQPVVTLKDESGDPNDDPFSALAAMAAAATSQHPTSGPADEMVNTPIAPAAESAGLSVPVVSTSDNFTPEVAPAFAPHHQVLPVHGFFSPSDAYPQHSQAANLETRGTFSAESAAQIARRKQILSSYHGLAGASAGPIARAVHLSGNSNAGRIHEYEPMGHSFQISPMSNLSLSRLSFGQANHTHHASQGSGGGNLPLASPHGAGLDRGSRPYFGYTLLSSNNFKPQVNLGTYTTSSVFTAQNRPSPQQPFPPERNTAERGNLGATNAVPSSHHGDSHFPGPHHPTAPHYTAAMAPPAYFAAPPPSNGPHSWLQGQSFLPRPTPTTAWPVQPPMQALQQVHHNGATPVSEHATAQGHSSVAAPAEEYHANPHLRGPTVDANRALGAVPGTSASPTVSMNQYANAMYTKPPATTNP
jgi:hypothetical protein